MLVKENAEPTDEREFLIPGRSLQILASVANDTDVFEVSDIGKEIVFVRGDMIFTIKKMLTGEFIDTAKLIGTIKPAYTAITESAKLKEELASMSVAAFMGGKKQPINLLFSNGEIILRCDGDFCQANAAMPANITQSTPSEGFYYDLEALNKLLQVVSGKVKIELDAKGFMLVKTRSEVYMQIPVAKPVKKPKPAVKQATAKNSPHQSGQKDETKKETSKAKRAKGTKDTKEKKDRKDAA